MNFWWIHGPSGFVAWVALHERILIGDGLEWLGVCGPHWCVLYRQNNEDTQHLLLRCEIDQFLHFTLGKTIFYF